MVTRTSTPARRASPNRPPDVADPGGADKAVDCSHLVTVIHGLVRCPRNSGLVHQGAHRLTLSRRVLHKVPERAW